MLLADGAPAPDDTDALPDELQAVLAHRHQGLA
jgi:hypothetical protein